MLFFNFSTSIDSFATSDISAVVIVIAQGKYCNYIIATHYDNFHQTIMNLEPSSQIEDSVCQTPQATNHYGASTEELI